MKKIGDDEAIMITDDMLEPQRIAFEQGMSYWPWVAIGLIAVNIGVFIWTLQSGALLSSEAIIAAGALQREQVLNGEYWRLLSALFLHADGEHLIGNGIMLYILGIACEYAFGRARMVWIYFFAGICGSILSVLAYPGPAVGASGAIFGLLGALITFLYRHKNQLVIRDNRIGFVLLMWAIYQVITGFMTPYIDNFAHLGGFFGGVIMALVVKSPLFR
ncbi:MAG: rhomboid family intramembrane serine protease [Pseudomonadota bacterium]|nr:rhomboid family intramembrane serine protease [Pseudomonadota bacterium]